MKLYKISTYGFDGYKINECEVIKETDKLYKVEGNYNVRKDCMTCYHDHYFHTEQEAKQFRLDLIKGRIGSLEKQLKELNDVLEMIKEK